MRSSNLLLPLALILSIQIGLVYTDPSAHFGTWTNSKIRTDSHPSCCVPTSIEIEYSGYGRLLARYKYTADNYYSKCYSLFGSYTGGSFPLTQTLKFPNQYYGDQTDREKNDMTFYFEVSNSTGLNVIGKSSYYTNPCDFALVSKNATNFVPIGILFGCFILIGALIAFKLYQKKQQNLIQQQSIAQPHSNYTAPNVNNYQGFPQSQPQGGFNQQTI